jgi:hypothetical protein
MRNICEKETARNPMNRRCTSARIGEKEKQEQGKKNHHPILQLTYTNSSPATERMPKTPRGRRRRSIPTQVREKRISRPLPGPTKSNSQGPAKERKLDSGALSRTFQQVLVLVLFSRFFLENTNVVTVVSTPRKLQYGNKFKNPNILKKKVLA